ncbi:dihydropyrimidinase [Petrotoga sp. 9PW.55.5.1]|uniref:dihydropyrimidinase n=1 Tax=Petrotoga sp. 9PW.55.5.1 TaxID=1308979 RepID=UPI000DC3009B|nr:dihydropyrimidinase [Petrotoga sp. 9PW.55.5.1]RAO98524.1 dihydropyrimidinase [Petrotoga sp. 9PW.55.5.1]
MLIKNGIVVTSKNCEKKDIRIKAEKIVEINYNLSPFLDEEVIDAKDKYVIPGVIDSHTHFSLHSRGTTSIDDFYSGGVSASLGGVTTHIDFADSEDGSLMKGLESRLEETINSVIDFHFHIVIDDKFNPIKDNAQLKEIKNFGISSLKAFTTYKGLYMISEDKWEPLFIKAKENDLIIAIHCEDDEIIQRNVEKFKKEKKLGVQYHPDIRPSIAEAKAIRKVCEIAEKVKATIYIVHLSSKEGYETVKTFKNKDFDLLVETTPHYLLLTKDKLKGSDGRLYLMTPPLREKEDNEALWQGIKENVIDVVATDHCAYSKEQKLMGKDSLDIFPGIPGVETLLPLVYTYGVKNGLFSINKMVELLSTNPAKIFKLFPKKGVIEKGSDADLVIFDPNIKEILNDKNTHSNAGYNPFNGFEVEGMPVTTILRGKVIVKDREFVGEKGYGKFVKAEF